MSSTQQKLESKTLKVPGATLYYELRGSGRVLLCITGGPTDAGMFSDLARRLADSYTVVTYDQRGHSRSPLDGKPEDIPVALHADDEGWWENVDYWTTPSEDCGDEAREEPCKTLDEWKAAWADLRAR